MGGWVDGWVVVKAVLRIAYSNQQGENFYLAQNDNKLLKWSVACRA
jgi:hypothetical protein